MCRTSPWDCLVYFGVRCAVRLSESSSAVFAAAMSYTGEPGRIKGRAYWDGDLSRPRPAHPLLPRGLDTALSAVTKWRR